MGLLKNFGKVQQSDRYKKVKDPAEINPQCVAGGGKQTDKALGIRLLSNSVGLPGSRLKFYQKKVGLSHKRRS